MEYPSNFETRAYPAGRSIAISRFMAICALALFLLIVFLCGLIVWTGRSDSLTPYMISADNAAGEWTIVGHDDVRHEYSRTRAIMESVVVKFTTDWFNPDAWARCERADCIADADRAGCALFCNSGEEVFNTFENNVMPDFASRMAGGETLVPDGDSLVVTPLGRVSDDGGVWRVNGVVTSNIGGAFDFAAYVRVARNDNFYPKTLGFYVATFNSYNVTGNK